MVYGISLLSCWSYVVVKSVEVSLCKTYIYVKLSNRANALKASKIYKSKDIFVVYANGY